VPLPRFELSRAAVADLNAIAEYTADRWGKEQTRVYLDALQARLTQLAYQPLIGRKRDELATGLLCFPFESHVVFYCATDFGIAVVRVLHERQDPFRHID
jgi:toxin ParE1/3/4